MRAVMLSSTVGGIAGGSVIYYGEPPKLVGAPACRLLPSEGVQRGSSG
jgi:hypothetical protein